MIRKNKKNILKLLLLVGVLSIGKNNVNAAQATDNTINADICIGGYYHSFSVSKENSNFDFYKVANLSISDLEKQAGYSLKEPGIFNINVDGVQVEFIYSFTRNFRCYTAMQKGNPSQVDSSAQYYHNGYNYIVKNCGNKYSINNLLFDTGTDGTNTVDASNGTISVVVRPKKGSTLDNDEVWKRLSADISYNGTPDYGKTGVGTCQTGSDATGRYMKCSGIAPYHRGWSMDTKKYNSDSYKLSFSLKGVTADDFTEKSEDKGKYVESCGGADGTIYLGEITTEIIDENKVMVNNPALTDPDLKAKCNELEKLNDEIKKSGLKGNSLKQCHDAKIKYTSSSKEKVTEALDKLKNTLESQKKAIESWSNTGSTVPGDSTDRKSVV